MSSVRLSSSSLNKLPKDVRVPNYDRGALSPGILHVGVGGFHRAHLAVYTDDLISAGESDWCIHGAGITPADERMNDALGGQDYLYTLVTRSSDEEEVRVIGAITNFFYAPYGAGRLAEMVVDSGYRIVSMTVTENGYKYAGAERHLDTSDPVIAYDLEHPDDPRSLVGFVFRVIQLCFEAGSALPTFMSCDNIPHNGAVLRKLVLSFAREVGSDLAARIEREACFPCSMVDRITPSTTDDHRAYLADSWGMEDAWPVVCEDFRQWFVEDRFSAARPDWSKVGATFVSDVTPYERMKIRLLNGSHSALSYPSYLLGYRRVDKAMEDDDIRRFVERYMAEVLPTVGQVPDMNLEEYCRTLVRRFSNPAIADQVRRLCEDGSRKIPNMMLEPVAELQQEGNATPCAAFAVAAWLRFLQGTDEQGEAVPIDDPRADDISTAAKASDSSPEPFLSLDFVFPESLGPESSFGEAVSRWYVAIRELGTRKALGKLLGEPD